MATTSAISDARALGRARRRMDQTPTDSVEPIEFSAELIARRAYELFLERGATHGHDVDDWLTAESELMRARSAQS